ncbi:DUF2835 domain-containing protein [Aeromonas molluscorum]|uniref:DUF2835 domain-containing protein n=1 Tax=Aeromonas molluscorum 848 TaxID=1268236 RepID=R1GY33_9GAMM|nr:DUF2835 domain-containing protein [Aeromonas molluscorum]EOD53321.1 hypothetical protein G113_20282 [Aeromonas molluscorum 848]
MKQFTFRLNLSRDEILLMYQGHARRLVVRSEQGLTLELGLDKIRPFVDQEGVRGRFLLKTQDDHRFIGLERIN